MLRPDFYLAFGFRGVLDWIAEDGSLAIVHLSRNVPH